MEVNEMQMWNRIVLPIKDKANLYLSLLYNSLDITKYMCEISFCTNCAWHYSNLQKRYYKEAIWKPSCDLKIINYDASNCTSWSASCGKISISDVKWFHKNSSTQGEDP